MLIDKRILIVEDDQDLCEILSLTLTNAGYTVALATNSKQCHEAIQETLTDLIILDIHLPECNGFDLCRELRRELTMPILILSGSNDDTDKLLALELGANNYLTKPISPRVLLSFLKTTFNPPSKPVVERKNTDKPIQADTTCLEFGKYSLNLSHQTLNTSDGKTIRITTTEFKILQLFLNKPYHVFSRNQIMDHIDAEEAYDRSIDRYIGRLRNKIEENPKNPKLIKSLPKAIEF